jgi:hypothetical protein
MLIEKIYQPYQNKSKHYIKYGFGVWELQYDNVMTGREKLSSFLLTKKRNWDGKIVLKNGSW